MTLECFRLRRSCPWSWNCEIFWKILRRVRGKPAHDRQVTGKVWCWQILGEYVCKHVCGRAVDESAYPVLDTLPEGVDSVVNVLGPVVGDWIFTHHATAVSVLIERCGCGLLDPDFF